MKRLFIISVMLFIALQASGCVRRIVTIESQPHGAEVYFNRKLIGQSPCNHEFLYYGTHRLELVKEGYANLHTTLKLKGPIYEYFPFCFFSEVLIPWQITDRHNFAFKLEKGQTEKPIISTIKQQQAPLPPVQLEIMEDRGEEEEGL